ncbi:MAG: single-stranded-DNA-specific exonuclease RecJ, partial [Planctomycetales bacterium]
MPKRWRVRTHDSGRIQQLARAASVPPLVAQLLLARDIEDPEVARVFLEAKLAQLRDPDDLPGLPAAADRVYKAVTEKRRIIIYGDYDVDGMTGTAILLRCLKLLGADVGYYVPSRVEEGYGLNEKAIREQAEQGASMVITVDCGVSAIEEARVAREVGLELVITDHHSFGEELPVAHEIVHPRLPGSDYPFAGLSGAGVALKLAWALCRKASGAKRVSERMRTALMQAVGLAALGTVADMVPLVDENRILVKHGLIAMKENPTLGMQSLMQRSRLDEKPDLSSEDMAFAISPRLNAAGRLSQARLAVELLTTDDESRALALAQHLDELNGNRQSLERKLYRAAHQQAKERFDPEHDPALVLADRGWHQGVIGIVAGRLAEKYHRPVVIISLDEHGAKPGTGSARSIPGFDLHKALTACSSHLAQHGGHAAAAGMTIEEDRVDDFREAFCEQARNNIAAEDLQAELLIDAESPLSAFTLRVMEQLDHLAPFGQANRRPIWCASGIQTAEPPRRIGKEGQHLSLRLKQ